MTDIQSACSVSRTSCSEEVLSSVVSFHDRQPTVLMPFWLSYLLEYKLSSFCRHQKKEFSCLKKLYPRDISFELVKGVFPGSFLLCLTTVHNK